MRKHRNPKSPGRVPLRPPNIRALNPLPLYSGGEGRVRGQRQVEVGSNPLTTGPSPPEYRRRGESIPSILCLLTALLVFTPAPAQQAEPLYRVEIDRNKVLPFVREVNGQRALHVTVGFKIRRARDNDIATDLVREEIVVEEDGRRVGNLEIFAPRAQNLTPVLALDISGSMAGSSKLDQAKQAARNFLDRLDERADGGLVLFDHLMRVKVPPSRDPTNYAAHRGKLRQHIDQATPGGGTAYLDAAAEAVAMLRGVPGRKAVLVMTDGVDMASRRTLAEVIAEAQSAETPIYTLGVGEPGKNEPVTTVLTLDQSGSMRDPANDTDRTPKIEALKTAASRFVDLMRPTAQTTLLAFHSEVVNPRPFTTDKADLKKRINTLRPLSGTLLYDATFAAIETLEAGQVRGKKAVVVLTDGMDGSPGSRHSDRQVIARAKETGIPLHMLGLGRKGEINEEVMKRMAQETGGTYHHATNKEALNSIFEKLSIDLHDDGIDEESLTKLAEETGGKYYPARDVSKLAEIYQRLAEELQSTYTVTFPSTRSSHDGTARGIAISVVRNGARVSDVASVDYATRGVIVPEMDYRVYLILLSILGVLLLAPAAIRSVWRSLTGAGQATPARPR